MLRAIIIGILSISSLGTIAQTQPMYVGTYTSNGSKGVYKYDFDQNTGKFTFLNAIEMSNPSFLARKGDFLYAVNEEQNGTITAVDLISQEILNNKTTDGGAPCHVSVSPKDPLLVISNYSGGSLIMYSLKPDGSLDKKEDFIQFENSSIDKSRQEKSHIHSAFFSSDGKSLFVSDLGGDVIYKIAVNKNGSDYSFNIVDEIKVKTGGGPRHLSLNEKGNFLYSVLEMTGEIEVLELVNNKWISKQILPIHNSGFNGEHGAGDIKMTKDGKFLYATNRGESNELVVYEVKKNGLLEIKQVLSVEGDSPRNLQLSPNEKWLIVANQKSGNLSLFKRNTKNGEVMELVSKELIPSSVCVIF